MMMKTSKIKEWFNFDWLKKASLVELTDVDISKDPVRPELDLKFRTSYGRKIYGLKHCLLYTSPSPRDG